MKLTSKGQLTIPKKLRNKLGISLNSELVIFEDGNSLRIMKQTDAGSPVDRVYGILKAQSRTDQLIKQLRGK